MSTVHHQEYVNTAYTQKVFVTLVLLASASEVILTTLADANRTRMTNTYCVYSVEILLMVESGLVRNKQSTLSNKSEK